MKKWSPTDHFPTDLEPVELSGKILDSFFAEEKAKVIAVLWQRGNLRSEGTSRAEDADGKVRKGKCEDQADRHKDWSSR